MKVWESFTNQKQWKEYLLSLLDKNDVAVKKAIITIYNFQMIDEKKSSKSLHENGKGFNKVDADFLSEMAIKIINRNELTDIELIKSRNKIKKYWKQLMFVSKEKMLKKKAVEEQAF